MAVGMNVAESVELLPLICVRIFRCQFHSSAEFVLIVRCVLWEKECELHGFLTVFTATQEAIYSLVWAQLEYIVVADVHA